MEVVQKRLVVGMQAFRGGIDSGADDVSTTTLHVAVHVKFDDDSCHHSIDLMDYFVYIIFVSMLLFKVTRYFGSDNQSGAQHNSKIYKLY